MPASGYRASDATEPPGAGEKTEKTARLLLLHQHPSPNIQPILFRPFQPSRHGSNMFRHVHKYEKWSQNLSFHTKKKSNSPDKHFSTPECPLRRKVCAVVCAGPRAVEQREEKYTGDCLCMLSTCDPDFKKKIEFKQGTKNNLQHVLGFFFASVPLIPLPVCQSDGWSICPIISRFVRRCLTILLHIVS